MFLLLGIQTVKLQDKIEMMDKEITCDLVPLPPLRYIGNFDTETETESEMPDEETDWEEFS